MKKAKFNIKAIFLFFVSLIFGLILFELCLNIFGYQKKPHSWIFANEEFYQDTNYRNFFTVNKDEIFMPRPNTTIIPDFWETDGNGFRLNPDHATRKTAAERILVLGDSQAYGHGVSNLENWPYLTEKSLQAHERDVLVYNAGVPATSTDQQFVRLQRLVGQVEPTTVIWMVSQNDMVDSNLSCLYKKSAKSEDYVRFPAYKNVAFINAWSMKLLPNWLINTNLGNLLTTFTIQGYDLFTIGCSEKVPDDVLSLSYFPKLEYQLRQAKIMAEENQFKLLVLFAPPQVYFDKEFTNDSYEITYFKKYPQTFTKAEVDYLDLPREFAVLLDQNLLAYRDGVLEKEEFLAKENLSLNLELYIDESVENVDYGGWHLNSLGNYLLAQILAEKL